MHGSQTYLLWIAGCIRVAHEPFGKVVYMVNITQMLHKLAFTQACIGILHNPLWNNSLWREACMQTPVEGGLYRGCVLSPAERDFHRSCAKPSVKQDIHGLWLYQTLWHGALTGTVHNPLWHGVCMRIAWNLLWEGFVCNPIWKGVTLGLHVNPVNRVVAYKPPLWRAQWGHVLEENLNSARPIRMQWSALHQTGMISKIHFFKVWHIT